MLNRFALLVLLVFMLAFGGNIISPLAATATFNKWFRRSEESDGQEIIRFGNSSAVHIKTFEKIDDFHPDMGVVAFTVGDAKFEYLHANYTALKSGEFSMLLLSSNRPNGCNCCCHVVAVISKMGRVRLIHMYQRGNSGFRELAEGVVAPKNQKMEILVLNDVFGSHDSEAETDDDGKIDSTDDTWRNLLDYRPLKKPHAPAMSTNTK